jgi:hypothetical protein
LIHHRHLPPLNNQETFFPPSGSQSHRIEMNHHCNRWSVQFPAVVVPRDWIWEFVVGWMEVSDLDLEVSNSIFLEQCFRKFI